ncbi:hypothetical protein [uncultured Aquimarina sp.]|uniref:hypothetical protein n=1 Tax=uncultured Aquimarina sp. TaxID=575652 RepID=UPI00260BB5D2|nr:hypothetical protein [uncultured Aquimarina sp.]
MKNYALLFLFALICCKSESKSPNETTVSNNITNSENVSDITVADNLIQKTYTIQGNSSKQNLSIQWISDTTIQYTLTFSNNTCNKTVGGRATIVKANGEPFAISHNGTSVEVDKYQEKKEGFKIILQIDSQNKDKAVVDLILTEDGENENCSPESAVMLEQK